LVSSLRSGDPPFPIADAIHLTVGSSAAGTIRAAGGRFVVFCHDNHAYGASSANPEQHRRLRTTHWKQVGEQVASRDIISAEDLHRALKGFAQESPLAIWAGARWTERLFLWWALDALDRVVRARSVWLATPYTIPGLTFLDSIACYDPSQLQQMFTRAQRLSHRAVKLGASRWRSFCGPTPRALAKPRAAKNFWIRIMPDYVAFFPRLEGRRLYISEFDEAILAPFAAKACLRPLDVLLSKRPAAVGELVMNHGDLLPRLRLAAWTMSKPLPALRRRETSEQRDWTRHVYQLTQHGMRVLDEGLGHIDWAPRLEMGGHAAYDPVRPWVARRRAGKWSLHPWRPGLR
jgi:Domain of unknown function (DUF1835)